MTISEKYCEAFTRYAIDNQNTEKTRSEIMAGVSSILGIPVAQMNMGPNDYAEPEVSKRPRAYKPTLFAHAGGVNSGRYYVLGINNVHQIHTAQPPTVNAQTMRAAQATQAVQATQAAQAARTDIIEKIKIALIADELASVIPPYGSYGIKQVIDFTDFAADRLMALLPKNYKVRYFPIEVRFADLYYDKHKKVMVHDGEVPAGELISAFGDIPCDGNGAADESNRVTVDMPQRHLLLGICCDSGRIIKYHKGFLNNRFFCNTDIFAVVLHEVFHWFEHELINAAATLGRSVDKEMRQLAAEYKKEFDNYIHPWEDYSGYYGQAVEVDARSFAGTVCGCFGNVIRRKGFEFLFKPKKTKNGARANISAGVREKISSRKISETELLTYLLKSKGFFDARGYENKKSKSGSTILQHEQDILDFLLAKFSEVNDINADYEKWHGDILRLTDFGMRAGFWQKMINITFKNMYCLAVCTDGYYFGGYDYKNCHCPVDSIISGRIVSYGYCGKSRKMLEAWNRHNKAGNNWNSMSVDMYYDFQQAVDEIRAPSFLPAGVLQSVNDPCRLDVDLLLW